MLSMMTLNTEQVQLFSNWSHLFSRCGSGDNTDSRVLGYLKL